LNSNSLSVVVIVGADRTGCSCCWYTTIAHNLSLASLSAKRTICRMADIQVYCLIHVNWKLYCFIMWYLTVCQFSWNLLSEGKSLEYSVLREFRKIQFWAVNSIV